MIQNDQHPACRNQARIVDRQSRPPADGGQGGQVCIMGKGEGEE